MHPKNGGLFADSNRMKINPRSYQRSSKVANMRKTYLLVITAALALQNSGARAADLGAQKWADVSQQWFSGQILTLYALTLFLLAATFVLKPSGVQFSQIYQAHWVGGPKLVFMATRLCLFALFAVLFLNMIFSRG